MKVTIYGTGYVGLVTGVCLAELGHEILCFDINQDKILQLQQGKIPIFEPGLAELLIKNQKSHLIHFTTELTKAVEHGVMQIICVNTPSDIHGAADISNVLKVAENIALHMQNYKLIVNKSTAPIGTAQEITKIIKENLQSRNQNISFDIASNPEFLKEGSAIEDFMQPDRVIIGVENNTAAKYFEDLYEVFAKQNKLMRMDIISAELTKYAANAMLATRISFINEIANLADSFGADINQIRAGIGSDPRIGPHFIAPGCGYGGSCFPKDVRALIQMAKAQGLSAELLNAVENVNNSQKHILFNKVKNHFGEEIRQLTVAVWGLAFKPNTDDIREATSHILLHDLWQAGAKVQAYDPIANNEIHKQYDERNDLILCDSAEKCLENADALIIVTEWQEFRLFDLNVMRNKLKQPVIFDGRNIFDAKIMAELGFKYYGIGQGLKAKN